MTQRPLTLRYLKTQLSLHPVQETYPKIVLKLQLKRFYYF